MGKWLFRSILIFSLGIIVYAAVSWYQTQPGDGSGVELVFREMASAQPGQPFTVTIGVANNTEQVLGDARLTVALPGGFSFVGQSEDRNTKTKIIGDVGVGGLTSQEFILLALPTTSSTSALEASLAYHLGLNPSRYEVRQSFPINLGTPAVDLQLEVPESNTNSSSFTLTVHYANAGAEDFEDLRLKLTYPAAFTFVSATPKPDEENNQWELGGLRRSSSNTVTITGQLAAPADANVEFQAVLEAVFDNQNYPIAQQTTTVAVKPPPFSLQLTVNGAADTVVHPGDELIYQVTFSQSLKNLRVRLTGELFDFGPLGSNVLNWETPTSPVSFRIRVKPDFPIKNLGDKNFILKAAAEGRAGKDIAVTSLETKVGGLVKIAARGYFRDAAAGVVNRGPLPLQVGQTTQFSIHWLVSNFGTDVSNIKMAAPLPEGVALMRIHRSTIAAEPAYDASANQIVWQIDRLLATQGAIGQPIEAVFQIAATPTTAMAEKIMALLGETTLTAADEFTGTVITAAGPAITTALPDDPTVGNQGIVIK